MDNVTPNPLPTEGENTSNVNVDNNQTSPVAPPNDVQRSEANVPPGEGQQAKPVEMVEIQKSELDILLNAAKQVTGLAQEVEQLKKGDTQSQKPKAVTARTVKVRLIKGQIVTGYGKCWDERQVDGQMILKGEAFTKVEGEEPKKHIVTMTELRDAADDSDYSFETCKIVEVHSDNDVISQGYTEKADVNYDNYRTLASGVTVPVEVVVPKVEFTLERPNGEKVRLAASALN